MENGHSQEKNDTTVNPLMVQLYRCVIDDVPNGENAGKDDSKDKKDPIYRAKEHDSQFNPDEYLEGFYKTAKEDGAMQIVLFFLPGISYRLPQKVGTLLDLGAGPTVYIPIVMRRRVEEIFISDYAKVNREHIISWVKCESKFDWSSVCKWIANIEATNETPEEMQAMARTKTKAVLEVNVHESPVIRGMPFKVDEQTMVPEQFDVVTSVFCLEYASETLDEYQRAVHGAVSLVKPNGHFIQGGVLHATEYAFGGRRFKCHFLTRDQLLSALDENGMCTTEENGFKLICHDDVFLLISRKCDNNIKLST